MEEVPPEVQEQALQVCSQLLGGTWSGLTINDFTINKIPAGLSNKIYILTLENHITSAQGEKRQVLMRMYGPMLQSNPGAILTDSVVFALLAEKRIGPRLYGVFPGGRLEEFVVSRTLARSDIHQPEISRECAVILSKFHQLNMPLPKDPEQIFNILQSYMDTVHKFSADDLTKPEDQAAYRSLQQRLAPGFGAEFTNLRCLLSKVNSPVLFCHNDLQEGNLLHSENEDGSWNLTPIDFEYACYNFRGFDLANHFNEWVYDYNVDEAPYFKQDYQLFPDREQQLNFIRAYLSASPGCDNNDVDATEKEEGVLEEVKAFVMMSDYYWGVWALAQLFTCNIKFGYLQYAIARFDSYFRNKQMYLEPR